MASIPKFGDLFRDHTYDIDMDVEYPTSDPIAMAIRKCVAHSQEAAKCLSSRGPEQSRCLDLFFNSRACLAKFIAPSFFLSLSSCMQSHHSFNSCVEPLQSMHEEVEKMLTDYDKKKPWSAEEKEAFSVCGSLFDAQSRSQMDMKVGCSMSYVCPVELALFSTCLQKTGGRINLCRSEARTLLVSFMPYLEKSWIKDPDYLLRGIPTPQPLMFKR